VVTFSPVDPDLAYAGNDAGGSSGGTLVRSTDGGANFTPADHGLNDQQHAVAALAVAPATPPLILAGIDPATGGGLVVGETDGSVPPPAPVAQEANAPPPATAAPAPRATARPKPSTAPRVTAGSSGLRRFYDRLVSWPLPLALEIFVLLLAGYILVRWRQHRLDVEGPP
jgi:hypothetical protein